jgi:hypothetical protein
VVCLQCLRRNKLTYPPHFSSQHVNLVTSVDLLSNKTSALFGWQHLLSDSESTVLLEHVPCNTITVTPWSSASAHDAYDDTRLTAVEQFMGLLFSCFEQNFQSFCMNLKVVFCLEIEHLYL